MRCQNINMHLWKYAIMKRKALFLDSIKQKPKIYNLSLHDALPIYRRAIRRDRRAIVWDGPRGEHDRSEEHTSELQSPVHLVYRLLLEKKRYKRAVTSKNKTLKLGNEKGARHSSYNDIFRAHL